MVPEQTARSRKEKRPQHWWQLRIELLEVAPAVWRRLIVPDEITLPTLHKVLQVSLGWTDSHLHEFAISGRRYAVPDPDGNDELDSGQRDECRVILREAGGDSARCFDYLYDFGDQWKHVVLIEDLNAAHPARTPVVRCIDGANACPPEDVGGGHAYAEFLKALADPFHERHTEYTEWIGTFDPTRFDLIGVNQALAGIET